MKKVILKACRQFLVLSPLVDEDNKEIHPDLVCQSDMLVDYLFRWQKEYNKPLMYNFWSLYQKLSFEREGLRLALLLSNSIPREIEFSYYSQLYEQEIKFYQEK